MDPSNNDNNSIVHFLYTSYTRLKKSFRIGSLFDSIWRNRYRITFNVHKKIIKLPLDHASSESPAIEITTKSFVHYLTYKNTTLEDQTLSMQRAIQEQISDCEGLACAIAEETMHMFERSRRRIWDNDFVVETSYGVIVPATPDQSSRISQILDWLILYFDDRVETDESAIKALEHKIVTSTMSEEDEQCSVCLEEFDAGCEVISMPCKHEFHGDCIESWLRKSCYCPLCRYEMPAKQQLSRKEIQDGVLEQIRTALGLLAVEF